MPNAKGWRSRRDERTGEAISLGDIVDGLMREEVFSRGIPVAELASKWRQIVGDRLAAETVADGVGGGSADRVRDQRTVGGAGPFPA